MPPTEIQFSTLVLRDVGDGFELNSTFTVRILPRTSLIAPEGMRTDGASIPRCFWSLIGSPLTGRYRMAAVIHDAGYVGSLQWIVNGLQVYYSRAEVDAMFLRLMKALGVAWWRRQAMYLAVRWFAGKCWEGQLDIEGR